MSGAGWALWAWEGKLAGCSCWPMLSCSGSRWSSTLHPAFVVCQPVPQLQPPTSHATRSHPSRFEAVDQDLCEASELHFPTVDIVVHCAASIRCAPQLPPVKRGGAQPARWGMPGCLAKLAARQQAGRVGRLTHLAQQHRRATHSTSSCHPPPAASTTTSTRPSAPTTGCVAPAAACLVVLHVGSCRIFLGGPTPVLISWGATAVEFQCSLAPHRTCCLST